MAKLNQLNVQLAMIDLGPCFGGNKSLQLVTNMALESAPILKLDPWIKAKLCQSNSREYWEAVWSNASVSPPASRSSTPTPLHSDPAHSAPTSPTSAPVVVYTTSAPASTGTMVDSANLDALLELTMGHLVTCNNNDHTLIEVGCPGHIVGIVKGYWNTESDKTLCFVVSIQYHAPDGEYLTHSYFSGDGNIMGVNWATLEPTID